MASTIGKKLSIRATHVNANTETTLADVLFGTRRSLAEALFCTPVAEYATL